MATALTKAKRLDTSRKNSLTRLLDSISQLLEDQSVSPERLVEARKGCKTSWDQYVLAHEALMEVRTDDEDPDEQEYGALETRKDEIGGALAEAITNRHRDRDAQKLQQDTLDKVAVRRLRLTNLHAQCKAQLSTLLESLTLVDPPTVDQLVVGESICLLYTSPSPRD